MKFYINYVEYKEWYKDTNECFWKCFTLTMWNIKAVEVMYDNERFSFYINYVEYKVQ